MNAVSPSAILYLLSATAREQRSPMNDATQSTERAPLEGPFSLCHCLTVLAPAAVVVAAAAVAAAPALAAALVVSRATHGAPASLQPA